MKKKTEINDILLELEFSEAEKTGFINCIKVAKLELNGESRTDLTISKIVEGVTNNEVSKN